MRATGSDISSSSQVGIRGMNKQAQAVADKPKPHRETQTVRCVAARPRDPEGAVPLSDNCSFCTSLESLESHSHHGAFGIPEKVMSSGSK